MSQTQQLSPAASLERQDTNKDPSKAKTRRPPNTAFRQQRLKAWQPILTPKTVLPLLFIVAVIFGPLGGLLLWASSQVQELSIDYSQCYKEPKDSESDIPSHRYNRFFKSNQQLFDQNPPSYINSDIHPKTAFGNGTNTYDTTQCSLRFYIPEEIKPPVYVYYRLTNYYQNHRRYVKSSNQNQLKGQHVDYGALSSCDPLRTPGDNHSAIYFPCGLIANSFFNDSFGQPTLMNPSGTDSEEPLVYNMSNRGIAWGSDSDLYGVNPGYDNSQILPPPNWEKMYPNGYTSDEPPPQLKHWEEFQNWMRTAGLPTFSKLVLRNDNETMKPGRYYVNITDNYHSDLWGGEKQLLISTRTVMGGKNSFLGIAYVVVAGICVLLGTVFTITNLIRPRRLGDHSYLSWNTDKPSTSTTSGRAPRPHDA